MRTRHRYGDPFILGFAWCLLADTLADLGIAGGATYDAIVAPTAVSNNCVLATRDARARASYDAVGATVEVVG